jgi:hypothetical protein
VRADHHRAALKPKPWEGLLPEPRASPKLVLEDVLEKAMAVNSVSSMMVVPRSQRGAAAMRAV